MKFKIFLNLIKLILKKTLKLPILFLKYQDKLFAKTAIISMKLLGRNKYPIHPKHLYDFNRNKMLINNLEKNIKGKFLDIGSGNGTELIRAAKLGWDAYGIENNENSIKVFNERNKNKFFNNINIYIHNLEIIPLPIDSNSINLINFSNVLEHIKKKKNILLEIKRVLINDGKCIISIPNKETFWKKLQRFVGIDSRDDIDHKIEYTKDELYKELSDAGLFISSKLHPIIISSPFDGLLSLTSIISPKLYQYTQAMKRRIVKDNINQSIGWVFEVKKLN